MLKASKTSSARDQTKGNFTGSCIDLRLKVLEEAIISDDENITESYSTGDDYSFAVDALLFRILCRY